MADSFNNHVLCTTGKIKKSHRIQNAYSNIPAITYSSNAF